MLLHLPQLLKAPALAQVHTLLRSAAWADGRGSAGPQAAAVKHNQQLPSDGDPARALQQLVLQALDGSALFFSAALPRRVLPPLFNRYAGDGSRYGAHVDQAIRYHPQNRQPQRSDISCTLFLSETGDYDGGELVVQHSFGEQRLKLAAGDAVLYPASSVHRVEPVTRGERLASFFWIESLVRSDERRRLLFDMDMALLKLREKHGDSDETVALTGTYHNLLRQWAQT